MNLTLNSAELLATLRTWQDAVVLGRRVGNGSFASDNHLRRSIAGAGERVDGCLMLLQSCTAEPAHMPQFNALVSELRSIRAWIQEGSEAVRIAQPSISTVKRKPRKTKAV